MELNRIKVVLVEKKKTGKWLAETLGKNEATDISLVCKCTSTSIETLFAIEKVLNVDMKDLLDFSKENIISLLSTTK